LVKRLKDVLENEVDEKYFLSDNALNYMSKPATGGYSDRLLFMNDSEKQLSGCITANHSKGIPYNVLKIGAIRGRNPEVGQPIKQTLEINENCTSNAITTVQKDNVVVIYANTAKGYDTAEEEEDSINFSVPNSETRRGRIGKGVSQTLDTQCNQGIATRQLSKQENESKKSDVFEIRNDVGIRYFEGNVCGTIRTIDSGGDKHTITNQRIRRLSPRECFRLMDFPETFKWDVSDSQAYKQAGNSICVGVLSQIISKLNLKTNSLC
jgi:DNA (cytosine-5)-methyltransferase 1